MFKKISVFIFILVFATLIKPTAGYGEDSSTCGGDLSNNDQLTKCLEEKQKDIDKYSAAVNSLSGQISLINSQISYTTLKITQTQSNIKSLENDIASLSVKIDQLNTSLNQLSSVYIEQVAQNYKLGKRYNQFSIFLTGQFNHILEQYKYLSDIQKNSQNTLVDLETVRAQADIQKVDKTNKQAELKTLQTKLASQQNNLNSQKNTKKNILALTQRQLDDAIAQLKQLRNFSKSNGSSCLSASPGGGSDGWFMSQRDPKWCRQFMGLSTDSIGEVGCFVSSVSMIWKKYGYEMTPSSYASKADHFVGATSWMSSPEVPPGFSYQSVGGYNKSFLDNALAAGHPVIAQVSMRNIAGMHFFVIKSGSNGNYKINDPWFGADINFSERYTTSSIISLRLISK